MSDSGKRDLARGWRQAEKLIDDEADRLAGMSDEEFEREMAAAPDPARVPSAQELLERGAERAAKRGGGESGAKVRALPVRPKRTPWMVWLVAAAVGGLVVVAVLWPAQHDVASGRHDSDAEGKQQAAKLREQAYAACGAGQWRACENGLLEAKRLDPEGDEEPRVKAAHKAALEGLHSDGGH